MLLCWNIGNTHTLLGLLKDSQLQHRWQIPSSLQKSPEDYIQFLRGTLLACSIDTESITGVVGCSVVPALTPVWTQVNKTVLGQSPLWVGPQLNTGLTIQIEHPETIGADRLANVVGAYQQFQSAVIVIDFGTATTIDVVSDAGEFEGGLICPGLRIAAEALSERGAQLPSIPLKKPPHVIGKNTLEALQSGVFTGYIEMIKALIRRLQQEWGCHQKAAPQIIATGGLATLIAAELPAITAIRENLTLEGLYFLYAMNHKEGPHV